MTLIRTYRFVVPPALVEPLFATCAERGYACAVESKGEGAVEFLVFVSEPASGRAATVERDAIAALLKRTAAAADIPYEPSDAGVRVEEKDEREYLLAYRDYFEPFAVSDRLLVVPSTERSIEPLPDQEVVIIEPGMAFGTGMHPTTRLCLAALAGMDLAGKTIVDAGTGSGILAIAAARLGARHVIAFDIDPVAVREATRNAKLNGVEDRVSLVVGGTELLRDVGSVDVVVANLTLDELVARAAHIGAAEARALLLSGFLADAGDSLVAAYERRGWALARLSTQHGWGCAEFARHGRQARPGAALL